MYVWGVDGRDVRLATDDDADRSRPRRALSAGRAGVAALVDVVVLLAEA